VADPSAAPLSQARGSIDAALARFCDRYLADLESGGRPVADAIRYSLLGEGKRLRALLAVGVYRAAGGPLNPSELAAAVEVVHAYSLVHDDLPCMDNDDVRRGRPTVHKVYGVPVATAAGLAMVPLAARCAWNAATAMQLPQSDCADIVKELMRASGAGGMVGGQLLDLEGEGLTLSLSALERIHRAKTGALISASVRIGAMAARAGVVVLHAFDAFGDAVGLAFQIADDVLDITATTDELGKTAGRDAALRKSTYPSVLGVAGATRRATRLVDDACEALRMERLLTPALEYLARYVVARRS
jgi:geranylgeranyl pyrophosphate synthase